MNGMNYFIQEERKAEFLYWRNGDYNSYFNKKKELYRMAGNSFCKERQNPVGGVYQNDIKYAGDLELAFLIDREEKEFRYVRKRLNRHEYGERLQKLICHRNQYAKTAGYGNYLDYKYDLWGIEDTVLNRVSAKHTGRPRTDMMQLKKMLSEISTNALLYAENQNTLLKQVSDYWNLNLDNIHIHDKDLPEFYIGACVPISIPDDVHVLMNKVSGLSGFSVFMHEIGHAFYYSNIAEEDINGKREPFNLIVEETIALIFENQVYTKDFLTCFLGIDKDMWFLKANAQLSYLLCCARFEENIYKTETPDFDKEWKKACDLVGEPEGEGWIKPHFFVSNPGYFAAYFIAGYLAGQIYLYANKDSSYLFDFLKNEICRPGIKLQYDLLLDKILYNDK